MIRKAKSNCPKCGAEVHGHMSEDPANNALLSWRCTRAGCASEWDAKQSDIVEEGKIPNAVCAVSADGSHVEHKPVHRIGVSFIAEVPNGAKLMVFNEQIFLVAPSMPPCFVTPTGLVPMQHADGSKVPQ